jgi:hypothetical protein
MASSRSQKRTPVDALLNPTHYPGVRRPIVKQRPRRPDTGDPSLSVSRDPLSVPPSTRAVFGGRVRPRDGETTFACLERTVDNFALRSR